MLSRIYLDSNALWSDRWPELPLARANVLALARQTGIRVYLPKCVEIELREKWQREIFATWTQLRKPIRRLSELIGHDIRVALGPLNELSSDSPGPRHVFDYYYDHRYERLRKDFHTLVIDSTTRPIDEFVTMAASHAAPFNEKERGFRDAVVLLSVMDHLALSPGSEACLWTADSDLSLERVKPLIDRAGVILDVVKNASALQESLEALLSTDEHQLWRDDRSAAFEAARRAVPTLKDWLLKALVGYDVSPFFRVEALVEVETLVIADVSTPLPSERQTPNAFPVDVSIDFSLLVLTAFMSPPNVSAHTDPRWAAEAWEEIQKNPNHDLERLTGKGTIQASALVGAGGYESFEFHSLTVDTYSAEPLR
jgi:hypothetical protein